MTKHVVHIHSGSHHLSESGELLQTTLGSCVAVCVYDKVKHIGGMVHFLLPNVSNAPKELSVSSNPWNFGDKAIPALLKLFKDRGSKLTDLEASVVGACINVNDANPFAQTIAKENEACAVSLLKSFGVTIAKTRTGGHAAGLRVRFDSQTGEILVSANPLTANKSAAAKEPVAAISPSKIPQHSVGNPGASSSTTNGSALKIHEPKSTEPVRVLIVDDSAPIRRILRAILEKYPEIKIVGEAKDTVEAEQQRRELKPDVMTLDIHMPGKDGVTYLGEIMRDTPMPVIMVSDLSLKEASPVMKALELGAFDYVQKPSLAGMQEVGMALKDLIVAAKRTPKHSLGHHHVSHRAQSLKSDASIQLLAIGASTGGTEALREVFVDFPSSTPPIVVVQHMPPVFTAAFAESLNRISKIEVREAKDNEKLSPSTAYIAPGGIQMRLAARGGGLYIELRDDPPVNRFKPSVDYLFDSIAKLAVAPATRAALLTGMGEDGARGMLNLKKAGTHTIAQNEETCVVYGMPRAAIERNAAIEILPLLEIASSLLKGTKQLKAS